MTKGALLQVAYQLVQMVYQQVGRQIPAQRIILSHPQGSGVSGKQDGLKSCLPGRTDVIAQIIADERHAISGDAAAGERSSRHFEQDG